MGDGLGGFSFNQGSNATPPQVAGVTDVVTQLQGIVRQLTAINQTLKGRFTIGTFKMAAAASTTVAEPAVQSNSTISITPTNASAATLMHANGWYISAIVAGASFTVTLGTGSAAGTETFSYILNTPT